MNFTWTCVFVAVIAVSVFATDADEDSYLQELTDAGISQDTAQKIVAVASSHKNDGNDPNSSSRVIFQKILDETDAVVKQAPAADQEAYKNFVEDKKNEFEKPDVAGNSDDE